MSDKEPPIIPPNPITGKPTPLRRRVKVIKDVARSDHDIVEEYAVPPEKMGKMKRDNIFHWSLDELIAYKAQGIMPVMIIDESNVYKLASCGISKKVICDILDVSMNWFITNSVLNAAFEKGRAAIAAKNRAKLVESAFDGNVQAMVYIDKIMGGDDVKQDVTVNVINADLKEVPTDQLIEVMFKQLGGEDGTNESS